MPKSNLKKAARTITEDTIRAVIKEKGIVLTEEKTEELIVKYTNKILPDLKEELIAAGLSEYVEKEIN